jgi:hypothetical protein
MTTKTPPSNRAIMRQYAMNFRLARQFALGFRDYHPALHEKWLLRAGRSVEKAVEARDA